MIRYLQFVASAKAVQLGHSINPDFKIGCMIAYGKQYPYTCSPEDVLLAQQQEEFSNYLMWRCSSKRRIFRIC